MQKLQNGKKQKASLKDSLKRVLADYGYSEDIADKIWKWYNPPELHASSLKNNNSI